MKKKSWKRMEQDETAVKGWTNMKIAGKGWNKTKQLENDGQI